MSSHQPAQTGEIFGFELELPALQLPQAEAMLGLLGALSLTLLGAGSDEVLEPEPGTTPVWRLTRIRALFADDVDLTRAKRVLSQSLGADINIAIVTLKDADWATALTAAPPEIRLGRRLMITAAQATHLPEDRTVVRLNRGLGFGTGEHPTTRLCLEWLDAELVPGATVIDYGCGSGILAVSAMCLGAARAWAVDIEPQALEATTANAALNAVDAQIWVGRPDELPATSADIVLANILSGPLIELAPRLAGLADSSGTLVLTGILLEQHAQVRAVYAAHFARLETREREGWACLIASDPLR